MQRSSRTATPRPPCSCENRSSVTANPKSELPPTSQSCRPGCSSSFSNWSPLFAGIVQGGKPQRFPSDCFVSRSVYCHFKLSSLQKLRIGEGSVGYECQRSCFLLHESVTMISPDIPTWIDLLPRLAISSKMPAAFRQVEISDSRQAKGWESCNDPAVRVPVLADRHATHR